MLKTKMAKLFDVCNICGGYVQHSNGTPLTEAASLGRIDIVQILLANGVEVNAKDNDGKTALMEAASLGRIEIVQALLDVGAEVNAEDKYGHIFSMEAASLGRISSCASLIGQGG